MRLVENERYEVTVKCSYEYFPVNYVLYFRGVYYCEDGPYMGKPYFKFSVDFTYSTSFIIIILRIFLLFASMYLKNHAALL